MNQKLSINATDLWLQSILAHEEPCRMWLEDPNFLEIQLFTTSQRTFVYRKEDNQPIGNIHFTGQHSGEVWLRGKLIGEYRMDPKGDLILTKVNNGLKEHESRGVKDPLAYLIERISQE